MPFPSKSWIFFLVYTTSPRQLFPWKSELFRDCSLVGGFLRMCFSLLWHFRQQTPSKLLQNHKTTCSVRTLFEIVHLSPLPRSTRHNSEKLGAVTSLDCSSLSPFGKAAEIWISEPSTEISARTVGRNNKKLQVFRDFFNPDFSVNYSIIS